MKKYKQRSHEQLSRAVNNSTFIWITITQDAPISDFDWKTKFNHLDTSHTVSIKSSLTGPKVIQLLVTCLWPYKHDPAARDMFVTLQTQTQTHTPAGSGDGSVVRVLHSWSKGRRFESLQEQWDNFILQGQLSVLILISVSVPPLYYHNST